MGRVSHPQSQKQIQEKEKYATIAQLVEQLICNQPVVGSNPIESLHCGNSSVGRAQPCQGWGREFESRFPLQIKNFVSDVVFLFQGLSPQKPRKY